MTTKKNDGYGGMEQTKTILDKQKPPVTLDELLVSSLAQTDALAKLLRRS
jgi:hypothetical protein